MKLTNTKDHVPALVIESGVLQAIQEFIGNYPAERGGMLGRDPDGVIRHFVPDRNALCSATAYDPDVASLNRQIKEWKSAGITFQGFVHSHPASYRVLSAAQAERHTLFEVAHALVLANSFSLIPTRCQPRTWQLKV
jgi:hypothetical protein